MAEIAIAAATIGAAGYSAYNGNKQQAQLKKAQARQDVLLADENTRLTRIEDGQRALRQRGRGLLAYDDGVSSDGTKRTLG